MEELRASGLPIFFDEAGGKLIFEDGLSCAGSSDKYAGGMRGLLMDERNLDEKEYYYTAYRDIVFEKDRPMFAKYGFRYDITLIGGGAINGERKKTSGHYHGYIEGKKFSYPEVYEVLSGTAVYILQKVPNFEAEGEPEIDELLAVTVREGQAIIIPPLYGHCSINAGDGPLIFSNIAVANCPLNYDAVKKKHGLASYLVERDGLRYARNPNYKNAPDIKPASPAENPSLGIEFGHPTYGVFVKKGEKFDFLLNPEKYLDSMNAMLVKEKL
jgi:glucose-6-phosphate isomerase